MKSKRSIALFLVISTLCMLFVPAVHAGSGMSWQTAIAASYDTTVPGTILPLKNELYGGGLDLYTGKMTTGKASADISFSSEGDYIGARDIIDLGVVDFDNIAVIPSDGYSSEAKTSVNHVYIVSTHKGEYAKVMVKSKLSSSVNLKYAIIDGAPAYEDGESGNTDYSNTELVDDSGKIAQTLEVIEGDPVDIRMGSYSDADESYEIYRSDNGGEFKSLTDFRLSSPSFTDNYALAGHTYFYMFVVYDSSEKMIYKSPLVKAVVAKEEASSLVITLKLGSTTASVNGKTTTLSAAPVVVSGRTLVPLRFIAEALGAQVDWSSTDRKITIKLNGDTMVLWIDKSNAQLNGKTLYMDVPPQIIKSSTMVPLRFISENLKQKIDFDNTTKQITIAGTQSTKDTPATPQPQEEDLSFYFKTWRLVVPGTVNSLPVESGELTINSNGTYVWVSPWEGKTLKGSWSRTGDSGYPISLSKGEDNTDWRVGKSGDGGIYVWNGSIWKNGYVKK